MYSPKVVDTAACDAGLERRDACLLRGLPGKMFRHKRLLWVVQDR